MISVRSLRARFALASLVCLLFSLASPCVLPLSATPQEDRPGVSATPELIATGQRSFDIPFSVNAEQANIVEVVLQVSTDQGKSWQEHSRRVPGAASFPFSSPHDGEFWFSIQTLDRNGKRAPANRMLKPELRIAVDTEQPVLEFHVRPDAAGRIVGSWTASDANIDPCSMLIQYQGESAGGANGDGWMTVPTHTCKKGASSTIRDELAWWPQGSARNLTIRAEIKDLAGNAVVVQRQMVLPLVAGQSPPVPSSATADGNRGAPVSPSVAGVSPSAAGTNYQRSRLPVALAHLYGNSPDPNPVKPASSSTNNSSPIPSRTTSRPANVPVESADFSSRNPAPQPPRSPSRYADNSLGSQNSNVMPTTQSGGSSQWRSRTTGGPSNSQVAGNSTQNWQARTGPQDVAPAGQARVASNLQGFRQESSGTETRRFQIPARSGNPPDNSGPLPTAATGGSSENGGTSSMNAQWISSTTGVREQPAPRPSTVMASGPKLESLRKMARPSNSRRFQMDYDIDAIGPEGVKTVELWMTRDGGNSWRRWTTDDDQRSPIDVEVDAEGIFGFRILVVSNEGLRARQPRRGDPADMWVNVDTTAPTAQITAVPYGRGQDAGRLLIQFRVTDANLSLRPIRLQFSPGADGPWTTIEDGIRNEGQYAWKPGMEIPDKVFLRLEARDNAGNVQTHTLTRPIDVSGLVPRGHIRGITPLTQPEETDT